MDFAQQLINQYKKLSERNQGRVDQYVENLICEQKCLEAQAERFTESKNVTSINFARKNGRQKKAAPGECVKGF